MAKKKGNKLEIDMCAGSQLRDTQGEILSVEGADISELIAGRGRFNDNHGKGFFNSVGRITEAKKIFTEDDCENERQKYYWQKIRAPYIYVKGYLYNDEEHPNAKAAAAILKSIHKSDAPLKLKASVEGGVVSRGLKDPALLAQTKIHSVALTFTPANNATLVEPLNLEKTALSSYDEELIKSVLHMATDNVPSFIDISEKMQMEQIAKKVETISTIVKALKNADNPEELKKNLRGLKNMATVVAMLQAAHYMSPPQGSGNDTATAKAPQQIERDMAGVQRKAETKSPYLMSHPELIDHIKEDHPHLWAIAQVESSGGHDVDHAQIKRGMHKGHKAGGPFGLMPKTVEFVVNRLDKDGHLADVYPQLGAMTKTPEHTKKYHKEITDMMNASPMMSFKVASALYGHLHKLHEGNADNIAHSWYHGANGTLKAVKRDGQGMIKMNDYVQKFNKHLSGLEKALTAGYGGAGAPTDLTGGGVMQSESFGGAKDGKLKYITCDKCGKEQSHAANQVKCRSCGSGFSLASLFKMID